MCVATLALIGAGIGAGSKVIGGIAKANSASYQAAVARNNAQIAQQNEAYAASAGASQTEQAGLKARARDAATRAALAANGVDVNSGSAADVQTSQREIGQLDAATVSNNAALEAYGYATKATDYTAQSQMYSREVAPDILGGVLGGAGELLGNPTVDSDISSGFKSLMQGDPSVPQDYSWMQSGDYAGPMA